MNAPMPLNLPEISSAKLPATYERAKTALAECSKIDECAEWAVKAEALASYAKQSRDESLRKMADRIQARAIARCGELLKQIPPAYGANQNIREGDLPNVTRKSAATNAGLSEHQNKQAIRVATFKEQALEEFERQIESDDPPTVTELAEQGKRSLVDLGKTSTADFKSATAALGHLRRFCEFANSTDPQSAASGLNKTEAKKAKEMVSVIDSWLDRFVTSMEI